MLFYSLSGGIPAKDRWRYVFGKNETFIDSLTDPSTFPSWLAPEELEYYADAFAKTGFRGVNQRGAGCRRT